MFEIVAFFNGLQCNGVTGTPNLPWSKKVQVQDCTSKIVHIINNALPTPLLFNEKNA
jgi:hypothetical protein